MWQVHQDKQGGAGWWDTPIAELGAEQAVAGRGASLEREKKEGRIIS